VDLDQVVGYALAARKRETQRNIWLAVLLVAFVVILLLPLGGAKAILLLISAIVAWLVIFYFEWFAYFRVVIPNLIAKSARVPSAPELPVPTREVGYPGGPRTNNVTVYSGYSPFTGSGIRVGGWSFAVNIAKGKQNLGTTLNPKPFAVGELYKSVIESISSLQIDGLSLESKLHVDGQRIRDDKQFLPSPEQRPNTWVDPRLVEQFAEHPTEAVRYYLCARVVSWQGELVVSMLLRFVKLNDKLFIEANYFVLPPIHPRYHAIDKLPLVPSWEKKLGLAMNALPRTLVLWPASPLILLASAAGFIERSNREGATLRLIRRSQVFDYGANASLREQAASPLYRRYFEKLDKEMYVKVIERHVLETLVRFLDQRDIDTSDFNEQRLTILNSGLIVSGGSVTADSLAVGEGARASGGGSDGGSRADGAGARAARAATPAT
jgi:hypothetical protein